MNAKKIVPRSSFFDEVRAILAQARQKAYAAVNVAMVEAYWEIGRRIVEEEQQGKGRAEYGSFLIKELSKQLTAEFGKGFAVANLWNFKQFYLTFPGEKLYALRRELTWTHYRLIMRVEGESAREYYSSLLPPQLRLKFVGFGGGVRRTERVGIGAKIHI